MAGRPRTITDEQLLTAVAVAVGRVGPVKLTLADVARGAGVSTGALAQRFGSKRNLLLAFASKGDAARAMRERFDSAPDPLEGLRQAVVTGMEQDQSPEEFANHLAFLHLDLSDPEFRTHLVGFERTTRVEIESYLSSAVAAGQLSDVDVVELAGVIVALRHGAQISWAITREGSLADAVRRTLDAVLAPFITRRS